MNLMRIIIPFQFFLFTIPKILTIDNLFLSDIQKEVFMMNLERKL